jgi:hypothetical protein
MCDKVRCEHKFRLDLIFDMFWPNTLKQMVNVGLQCWRRMTSLYDVQLSLSSDCGMGDTTTTRFRLWRSPGRISPACSRNCMWRQTSSCRTKCNIQRSLHFCVPEVFAMDDGSPVRRQQHRDRAWVGLSVISAVSLSTKL